MTGKTCLWHRDADDDTYQACGSSSFYFVDGFLSDQGGFKFCPYCGLEIDASEPIECSECGREFQTDVPRQILCDDCRDLDEKGHATDD